MFHKASPGATIRPLHSSPTPVGMVTEQREEAALPPPDTDRLAEEDFGGFELFGRCGLDLGGLHRDRQWVGAWGGRC